MAIKSTAELRVRLATLLGIGVLVGLFLWTLNWVSRGSSGAQDVATESSGQNRGLASVDLPAAASDTLGASAKAEPTVAAGAAGASGNRALTAGPGDDHSEIHQGLARLQKESRVPWEAVFDPLPGQKPRLRSLRAGSTDLTGTSVSDKSDDFVRRFAKLLFDVNPESLKQESSSQAARTKVTFTQSASGMPVYGGTLTLLYEGATLVRVQNDLASVGDQTFQRPEMTAEQAVEEYRARPVAGMRGVASNAPAEGVRVELVDRPDLSPKLMLYPVSEILVPVYQFYVREFGSKGATEQYRIIMDATDHHVILKTATQIR